MVYIWQVGVLIGKAGDTIRYLQYNSGARIQITRDADADPYSGTRPVELIGTLENITKAEKLIKDVIAEVQFVLPVFSLLLYSLTFCYYNVVQADAGGSPALVARGFNTVQAAGAGEQTQIQVPNEKVTPLSLFIEMINSIFLVAGTLCILISYCRLV